MWHSSDIWLVESSELSDINCNKKVIDLHVPSFSPFMLIDSIYLPQLQVIDNVILRSVQVFECFYIERLLTWASSAITALFPTIQQQFLHHILTDYVWYSKFHMRAWLNFQKQEGCFHGNVFHSLWDLSLQETWTSSCMKFFWHCWAEDCQGSLM